ncbi:MAG: hypothetical protein KJO53_02870 [Eudoraea sp.]|nr:hypothetical protein [Eudoraea sp.]
MKRKEFFWFIGTIGLALIITLVLFGLDGFNPDSTFDINIHDTYFVIANIQMVPLIMIFTFFIIYFIRTIIQRFKNITTNLILIIATILFAIVLGKTIGILDSFNRPTNHTEILIDKNPVGDTLTILSNSIFIIQIGLLLLLLYSGFKTGQNFIAKKN